MAGKLEAQKNKKERFPILLVEDERITRIVIEKLLIKSGYEVTSVCDGSEAWELLKEKFFPIILTDWMMPVMDGLELCRKIRMASFPGYVFVILLTAMDTKSDVIKGLEAGADEYLTKPFDHAELVARLNTANRILQLELSLKQANREIITDPLTGAYNRGFFITGLPREIRRAVRYNHPVTLVMCDIDFFKEVNDNYGHPVGDQVLISFVKCLRELTRVDVDLLVRYGGEEFAIIMPETGIDSALRSAERIRQAVEEMSHTVNGVEIKITASFGSATFDPSQRDDPVSTDRMLDEADKYLYQSKNEGRNRVKGGMI